MKIFFQLDRWRFVYIYVSACSRCCCAHSPTQGRSEWSEWTPFLMLKFLFTRKAISLEICSVHSASDYKKHLYKKRLVNIVLTKKRTLVYFSHLRTAHTNIYPLQSQKLIFCLSKCFGASDSKRFAWRLQKFRQMFHQKGQNFKDLKRIRSKSLQSVKN